MIGEVWKRLQEAELQKPALLLYKSAQVLERIDACVEELNDRDGVFSLLNLSGDTVVAMTVHFSPGSVEESQMKLVVRAHPVHTLQNFEIIFDSPDLSGELLQSPRVFQMRFVNDVYQITLQQDDPRTDSLNDFIRAIKYKISYPPTQTLNE